MQKCHVVLWLAVLSLAAASCSRLSIDLTGRPCDAHGACAADYLCDPQTNTCMAPADMACLQEGLCICDEAGACFLCSDNDRLHCGVGCAACSDTTPACVGGSCVCDDLSCGATKWCDNSNGRCVDCGDADSDHCGPQCAVCSGDTPLCDGGRCLCAADSCPQGSWCDAASGSCAPCGDSDARHCGSSCAACGDTAPACVGGVCVCSEGSCGSGALCDNASGSCIACNSADSCGATCAPCSAAHPWCDGQQCICTNDLSCGVGNYCAAGQCSACDLDNRCGANCVACGGSQPACDGAACVCTATSCAAGSYCGSDGACHGCNCPAMFPYCSDGTAQSCRCNDASCSAASSLAGSCSGGTHCLYADNFETASSSMAVCGDSINSSWALGTPSGFTVCNSGSRCWGTNLTGNYNDCELSCIEAPVLNLAGLAGTVQIGFAGKYNLESNFDGVTLRARAVDGSWNTVAPSGGYDVAKVILGASCTWTDVTWPAWGQYTTTGTIGWGSESFSYTSAAAPQFFYNGFTWRLYLETDGNTVDVGYYFDDLAIDVAYQP